MDSKLRYLYILVLDFATRFALFGSHCESRHSKIIKSYFSTKKNSTPEHQIFTKMNLISSKYIQSRFWLSPRRLNITQKIGWKCTTFSGKSLRQNDKKCIHMSKWNNKRKNKRTMQKVHLQKTENILLKNDYLWLSLTKSTLLQQAKVLYSSSFSSSIFSSLFIQSVLQKYFPEIFTKVGVFVSIKMKLVSFSHTRPPPPTVYFVWAGVSYTNSSYLWR